MPSRSALVVLFLGAVLATQSEREPLARRGEGDATTFAAASAAPDISTRISDFLSQPQVVVLGTTLEESDALARFYANRAGKLAWTDAPQAFASLLDAVRTADSHGLRPGQYHLDAIAALAIAEQGAPAAPDMRVERDLVLSDAFLHLARALSAGGVDPRALEPRYARGEVLPDPVEALEAAVSGSDPATVLAALAPPHPDYAQLRAGLAKLRAGPLDAAACPGLQHGPLLRLGARDPRVARLRACLRESAQETRDAGGDPTRFNAELDKALRAFQQQNALAPDGILGPETVAALVTTRAQRIDQVRVNLERWRWQPRDFGPRFVRVDVPRYRLRAFEVGESEPVLEIRVVVGRPTWETPTVHSAITRLVLNPAWEVPESIFENEMLPLARRDPGYFAAEGLELWEQRDGVWRELDSAATDWARVDPDRTRFRVRQPPGPRNPLGRIEFMFQNPYSIYLHGTPARAALEQSERVLSHGCVRVEDELALARFALAPDPTWTSERLTEVLEKGLRERLPLPDPLPVHIVYFTAEADAGGTLSFTSDPYGWDAQLLERLGRDEPAN